MLYVKFQVSFAAFHDIIELVHFGFAVCHIMVCILVKAGLELVMKKLELGFARLEHCFSIPQSNVLDLDAFDVKRHVFLNAGTVLLRVCSLLDETLFCVIEFRRKLTQDLGVLDLKTIDARGVGARRGEKFEAAVEFGLQEPDGFEGARVAACDHPEQLVLLLDLCLETLDVPLLVLDVLVALDKVVVELFDQAVLAHKDVVLDLDKVALALDGPDVSSDTVLEALDGLALALDDAVLFAQIALAFRGRLGEWGDLLPWHANAISVARHNPLDGDESSNQEARQDEEDDVGQ